MAPSDNTKIALGVLTVAGLGLTLYLLSRQLRKKKKPTEAASSEPAPSHDDQGKKAPETLSGGGDTGTERDTPASESPPVDPSSVSMSLSSWEELQAPPDSLGESAPLSESFVEMHTSGIQSQGTGGDTIGSQSSRDVLGSFTEISSEQSSASQQKGGDKGENSEVTEQQGGNDDERRADDQQLQSEGTSNDGDLPSFEHINGSDDAASLPGSNGADVTDSLANVRIDPFAAQQLMAESMMSFEQTAKEGSGQSMQSFEQISDPGHSWAKLGESTTEGVPPSSDDQCTDDKGCKSQDRSGVEVTQGEGSVSQTNGKHEELSKSEENGTKPHTNGTSHESGDNATGAPRQNGDGDENGLASELVKRALGGSREEFYSSESLQSFATATSSSSGRTQDFYSPISSPREMDTSADNLSFRSFDDSQDSEEMSFYDVDTAGARTPQDRTPTNTPPLTGNGAEKEMSTSVMESSMLTVVEAPSPAPPLSSGSSRLLSLDRDKMTEAIMQAQSNPGQLEIGQLQILVELLKQDDIRLLNTAIMCIIQATSFTINVNILTVCQAPKELAGLLERLTPRIISGEPLEKSQGDGTPETETLFLSTVRAVNNLAMDMKAQPQLESTIPMLTDLLMTEGISETVTLASLQPLTNMAASKTYHGHYTRLLQQLYSFLDTSQSASLRLQCLKLLVNLSLNADMVPHMLAAKAPSCLLDLLDVNYDVDLLLRTVTFLANVMTIMQERQLTPSSLPPDEKAPSPETLYSALSALDKRDTLRNKIFRLTRHQSEDVSYQASRLYKCVTSAK